MDESPSLILSRAKVLGHDLSDLEMKEIVGYTVSIELDTAEEANQLIYTAWEEGFVKDYRQITIARNVAFHGADVEWIDRFELLDDMRKAEVAEKSKKMKEFVFPTCFEEE